MWRPQAVWETATEFDSYVGVFSEEQDRSPHDLKSTAANKPSLLKFRLHESSRLAYMAGDKVPALTRSEAAASKSTVRWISAAVQTWNLVGSAHVISQ